MAIYTGKTNMIDKVVVTNGSTPEEMDYVYVTNALGKRELVFEQKPPAPDDNTQTNPPILRKWSANIKGDVTGRLFFSNVLHRTETKASGEIGISNRTIYSAFLYQYSPYLSLKADGNGGYKFEVKAGIQGNGWGWRLSNPRYPTTSELTDLGVHSPYTGSLATSSITSKVTGLPLATEPNYEVSDYWKSSSRDAMRRHSLAINRLRYSGTTALNINPNTPNGTYRAVLEVPSSIAGIGHCATGVIVIFTRASSYDAIDITGISILGSSGRSISDWTRFLIYPDGNLRHHTYSIMLRRKEAKEEPPINELVTVSNISRGIGGNPKAFRMGDEVNFTVDVKGVY